MPDGTLSELALFARRCKADFRFYAARLLKVKPKVGGANVVLTLNRAQQYIHERIETQRANTGKVRALILKSRQQGASTYIEARFFWRTQFWQAMKVFVLTHEDKATQNLFGMARRFQDNLPDTFKQRLKAANANTLHFAGTEGEYAVATAGTKEVGRSQTAQLFHGSECAFWPNADTHAKGIGQTVANEAGTEIILESTGNGIGGDFHERWQAAEAEISEYIAIFIPWFWTDEYRLPVPDDFEFSSEDRELQALYGYDDEQAYWRHRKIADDFKGDASFFKQEYPANSVEAFTANTDSYLPGADVDRARKDKTAVPNDTLIIGVDPKRFGEDRFGICRRRGRVVTKIYGSRAKITTMEAAGMLVQIIVNEQPARMFVDIGGLGAGVVDRLHELGYTCVIGVNSGSAADEPERFINKRAEMRGRAKEWLEDVPNKIPDSDEFARDLLAPGYKYDSNNRLKIESKEDMRKRGVRSPDLGDAFDLTFAYPVAPTVTGTPKNLNLMGDVPWQAR